MIRTGMDTPDELVTMSRKEFDERVKLTYELGRGAGKLEGAQAMLATVMQKLKEQKIVS